MRTLNDYGMSLGFVSLEQADDTTINAVVWDDGTLYGIYASIISGNTDAASVLRCLLSTVAQTGTFTIPTGIVAGTRGVFYTPSAPIPVQAGDVLQISTAAIPTQTGANNTRITAIIRR